MREPKIPAYEPKHRAPYVSGEPSMASHDTDVFGGHQCPVCMPEHYAKGAKHRRLSPMMAGMVTP